MSDHGRGEHSGHDLFDAPPDSGECEVPGDLQKRAYAIYERVMAGDWGRDEVLVAVEDAQRDAINNWETAKDRARVLASPAAALPLPLAQRILAALVGQAAREDAAKFPETAKRLDALADELRKEMGK